MIAATSTVIQDIVDNADERELWIVGREFERPPYFIAGKGGDTRLARALRLCIDEKITPNSDGSYSVEGSHGRSYRVTDSCSCPNSQKASTKYCYHFVAVCLYVEWQKRLRPAQPVALGTLRPGTLPLPPVSVDERLAQAAHDAQARASALDAVPNFQAVSDQLERERLAESATYTPQEDVMPDNEYIPEPDDHDAPVAVEDEPDLSPPAPVKIPREFTVNIKGKTHVLYTGLVVAARANGLVTLSADWTYNDAELSLAHAVCTFADGRRYEESGDATPSNVSKGISLHFRRVALTRAKARCLRDALGISECSVEELEDASGKPDVPDMNTGALRHRIWTIVQQQAPAAKTKEQVSAWIMDHTGYQLLDHNFRAILGALEGK